MHGRLKVRTSAEEKERKKKEQLLKMRAYKAAMSKILAKRKALELDDELLQLTTQILQRNPDIATLWNIRRECMEKKSVALQSDEEQLQAAYDAELNISEHCLVVNPKSYYAWHHRCWTLEHSPHANWQRELLLCNKYLKLDARNFHTWDYRRYVVEKAGIAKQQELDYCTELIKQNFSNYSSWHHRSLLLPVLYPYDGDELPKRPMCEAKLKEELEMVITAAFTDPNDSSAWFYQRWLLGQSKAELAACAFRCNGQKAVLSFTQPTAAQTMSVHLKVNNEQLLTLHSWQPVSENGVCSTWHTQLIGDTLIAATQLEINIPNTYTATLALTKHDNELCYFMPPNRAFQYSNAVQTELQSQLESCQSLLEYEPDSKWTLLTSALLMRELDPIAYHAQSMAYLKQLQTVDPMRLGYYMDLASKWQLEHFFNDWQHSKDFPKLLDLSEEPDLATLPYKQYLSIADKIMLPFVLAGKLTERGALPRTFSNLR